MKKSIQILLVALACSILVSCKMNNEIDGITKSFDGIDISYSHYGKGKGLIVFVHGWSCDKSYWDKQVEYFKEDYQVVTIDLGGHGNSGLGRNDWTISSFGEDVVSVLKLLKYEKLIMVGHSMGADVVIDAASKLESNKIDLLLVDRFLNTPKPWPEDNLNRFLKPFEDDFPNKCKEWVKGPIFFISDSNPELVEWISNDMSQANVKVALSALRNVFLNDIIPLINALKEKGISMTAINSDYQKTNIENLKELGFNIEIISGTGHFIMMELPDLFNETIPELIVQ